MFTDIVGYTKLMQESETTAVQVRIRHREVIVTSHAKYNGKVIQYLGDGTLSIFDSAIDSVRCAIELQQVLQVEPMIPLRIGIHLGDVMVTEHDIIGNSVNIASRIESLGCGGSILISDKVREEIHNQEISVSGLGIFHFKNDRIPREIFAISVAGINIPEPSQISGKFIEKPDLTTAENFGNSKMINVSSGDLFVRKVRDIIEANLSDTNFSVATLCKGAALSRPQLYRKLQSEIGLSPSDFIREIRLQKALTLLKSNAGNVSEIAFKCGFNNLSYFSKAFFDKFQVKPSDYTKKTANSLRGSKKLNEFIGRDQEIKEITKLLSSARLVTLTGTGGTGKTRLAIEVIHILQERYSNGAFFVQLAPTNTASAVLPKIAQILKIPQDPTKDTLTTIAEFISRQEILLVLDNFEHVLEASSEVSQLLEMCHNLTVMITSRVVLNIAGEFEFPVGQLMVPESNKDYSLEEFAAIPSVHLLLLRAKAAKPRFEITETNRDAIISICQRLDGLPLAIELAAARIKIFSPQALWKRLSTSLDILSSSSHTHPVRHKTLKKAIEWSYNLLSPEEQTLFRRLSIFGGGCTLESAEEVCFSGYRDNLEFIDIITSLVDKSLLYQEEQNDGEPRFFMLETIREFGQDRLEAYQEKEDIISKYIHYFIDLLEGGESTLASPSNSSWLDQLELELDNIRQILTISSNEGDAESALKVATSFWRYWTIRSMMREGTQWLKRILDLPQSNQHAELMCKGLNAYGIMFTLTNNWSDSITVFQKSLAVARREGLEIVRAQALNHLGWAYQFACDFKNCISTSQQALELHTKNKDQRGIGVSLNNLAWVHFWQGKVEEAADYFKQSKEIREGVGDYRGHAFATICENMSKMYQGVEEDVVQELESSVQFLEEISDDQIMAWGITIHAEYLYLNNHLDSCLQLAEYSRKIWHKIGTFTGLIWTDIIYAEIQMKKGELNGLQELLMGLLHDSEKSAKNYIPKVRYTLSKLYHKRGNTEKAFELLNTSIKDIIDLGIFIFLPQTLELYALYCLHMDKHETAFSMFISAQHFRNKLHLPLPPIHGNINREIERIFQEEMKENARLNIQEEKLTIDVQDIIRLL